MSRRASLYSALTLSWLTIAGCGDSSTPTQAVPAEEDQRETAEAITLAVNSWSTRADMPTARYGLGAGVVNNSSGQPILYAIGGTTAFNPTLVETRVVEAYNFATNSWRQRASLPVTLFGNNGVGVIGGKLYISSGGLLFRYDPVLNTWTRKADMPARVEVGVSGVIDGKLYVLAGFTSTGCENDHLCGGDDPRLFRYDPATNTWNSSLPAAPSEHLLGAGTVLNGKFYVAGGIAGNILTKKLHVYDPIRNSWQEKASMLHRRHSAAAAPLQGQLYVIGGRDDVSTIQSVQAYDPVTNTWSNKAPIPIGRSSAAAARVIYGGQPRILVVGGVRNDGEILKSTKVYTP